MVYVGRVVRGVCGDGGCGACVESGVCGEGGCVVCVGRVVMWCVGWCVTYVRMCVCGVVCG